MVLEHQDREKKKRTNISLEMWHHFTGMVYLVGGIEEGDVR